MGSVRRAVGPVGPKQKVLAVLIGMKEVIYSRQNRLLLGQGIFVLLFFCTESL